MLLPGLVLFGVGDAFVVASELGNAPWTVLAQGVSLHTPLTIGVATQVIGALVLLGWLPLRERPGLGTVLNVVIIGLAIDATLAALPDLHGYATRTVALLAGVAIVGIGSGFYLSADLGPGPRDGLMTGLHRRRGWPIVRVRLGIELTVLVAGAALGGTVGLGTVLFALLIGPAVGAGLRAVGARGARVPATSEP
jgi:uncharacterized membrane protein YczE